MNPLLGNLIGEHSRLIERAEEGRLRSSQDQPLLKMTIVSLPGEEDAKPTFTFVEIDPEPL